MQALIMCGHPTVLSPPSRTGAHNRAASDKESQSVKEKRDALNSIELWPFSKVM